LTIRLSVDENPNCELFDTRIFNEHEQPRAITHVIRQQNGRDVWCPIVAWDDSGAAGAAQARKVDDSGDGTCYLVSGGRWGLRLKYPDCAHDWSQDDPHQWGEAFLLLPADGSDLRFAASPP